MFTNKNQLSLLLICTLSLLIPLCGVFFYDYYMAKSLNHLVTIEPTNFFLPESLLSSSKTLGIIFIFQFIFLSIMMTIFVRKKILAPNLAYKKDIRDSNRNLIDDIREKVKTIDLLKEQLTMSQKEEVEKKLEESQKKPKEENSQIQCVYVEKEPEVRVETKEIIKTVEVSVPKEIVVYPDKTPISVSIVASKHMERLIKNYEDNYYNEGFKIGKLKSFIKSANQANYTIMDNLEAYHGEAINLDPVQEKIDH